MLDDLGDSSLKLKKMQKDIERLQNVAGRGGDSQHLGAGYESIQVGARAQGDDVSSIAIGPDAKASPITDTTAEEGVALGSQATADGFGATAIGARSYAQYETATALGWLAFSGHLRSTAIGQQAVTTAADQIRLGRSGASAPTVSVPGNLTVQGTFSNPSARHLKTNIEPVGCLRDVFPPLYEYEYLARRGERRLGHLADELVGTDAERFVTLDEHGDAAINYLDLRGAQLYALRAELGDAQAEVAELRAENDEIRARLTALESTMRG